MDTDKYISLEQAKDIIRGLHNKQRQFAKKLKILTNRLLDLDWIEREIDEIHKIGGHYFAPSALDECLDFFEYLEEWIEEIRKLEDHEYCCNRYSQYLKDPKDKELTQREFQFETIGVQGIREFLLRLPTEPTPDNRQLEFAFMKEEV